MDWLAYLLATVAVVVGLVVGFALSGLWIIAIPWWRRRHQRTR